MNLITAGLHKNTFRMHGKPLTYVSYRSHRAALDFLRNTYSQDTGPGVLAGPPMIGKTTVVRNFVRGLPANTAVAAVDCQNLVSGGLLNAVLTQFGFLQDRLNENEKLKLLNVFLDRQTAIFHPSLLLIENAHELRPSEYQALQQMFEARYKGRSTLRVILIGDSSLGLVIDALRAHN
ncbi:MAG: ATP-binding protein, partial [Woeseiaceae bacterium]|nr:ATP-binding protein [Woeseiaceae bacterium]